MGILIGLDKVSHEWPGKKVLADVSIGINEGDRIGIVGRNGDGKSTLLACIAKSFEPDSGTVTWRNTISVGFIGQSDALDDETTVGKAVLGDRAEFEWASDGRIRSIIAELLRAIPLDALVGTLSGGERKRCDLARVLIGTWDVLLLDEPTNHLDMHAIAWLAAHLASRWPEGEGALLAVTHDRWFLDEVCRRMWEVHHRSIGSFEGGYSAYIQQRVERDRSAALLEERRRNTLRKELNWLSHGARARTSKPKFRIEAARALLADDPPIRNSVELKRLAVARLGKQVIELESVSLSFGDTVVLEDIDWIIGPGERISILGANGAGKTSLLRIMTGLLAPTGGSVKIGRSVRFGWLSQQLDNLQGKGDWRVLDLLARYKQHLIVEDRPTSPAKLLERLGFDASDMTERISELSGGQRRRLALLCVLIDEPNVLVLDEPGNDLDTDMLAELESLLDTWPGTLLLVTHDRYLAERVADNQYALINGHLRHVPDGIDGYLHLLDECMSGGASPDIHPSSRSAAERSVSPHAERRERKKRLDAIERKLEKLRHEPARLEAELHALDQTDYEALLAKQAELEDTRTQIDELESEWLILIDMIR
ncbi:ABC transporter ATP-binding protein [Coriobacteriales bacterium OH1046]|nr:ABC transporter ATP-binding protein [Coriobacteriales bacterium OH1046]